MARRAGIVLACDGDFDGHSHRDSIPSPGVFALKPHSANISIDDLADTMRTLAASRFSGQETIDSGCSLGACRCVLRERADRKCSSSKKSLAHSLSRDDHRECFVLQNPICSADDHRMHRRIRDIDRNPK